MNRRTSHPCTHDVFETLAQDSGAPDLSRRIMGRLGYMRLAPEAARRRRLAIWSNRAGVAMIAAVALAIGWRVFEASPNVRRPAETTIPDAVNHDFQMQQQRFEGAIRGIRMISTPRLRIDDRDGNGAAGTNLDDPTDGRRSAPSSPQLEDDVNRSSIAPVRWV